MDAVKKKGKAKDPVDTVFSWELDDVFNDELYKNQVKEIPRSFSSFKDYPTSFTVPLLEETRTALRSSMDRISEAPVFQVLSVNRPTDAKRADYMLVVNQVSCDQVEADGLKNGDLFALSSVVRPQSVGDLVTSNRPYSLAMVTQRRDEDGEDPVYAIEVKTSKPLAFTAGMDPKKKPIYAVLLENLITNNRIWKCLKPGMKPSGVTKKIALYDGTSKSDDCDCWSSTSGAVDDNRVETILGRFNLNDGQAAAVLSCLSGRKCRHQPTAKLIWGPPGTGKTKTVATLLWTLLEHKCRTLTCAPTNVAVVQIALRLLAMLEEQMPSASSFGDVVLFGNIKKMRIEELGLETIYLKHRVHQLQHCFARLTGWNNHLTEMIALFEDSSCGYYSYLADFKATNLNKGRQKENGEQMRKEKGVEKKTVDDDKDRTTESMEDKMAQKHKYNEKQKRVKKDEKEKEAKERIKVDESLPSPMTFRQYMSKRFIAISHNLKEHVTILRRHLSSKKLTSVVTEHVDTFVGMMESLKIWLSSGPNADTDLKEVYTIPVQIEAKMTVDDEWMKISFQLAGRNGLSIQEICNDWSDTATRSAWRIRLEFLHIASSLLRMLKLPLNPEQRSIEEFCLEDASVILCTACTSFRLRRVSGLVELLIVDEAAQLKECESLIPMQLPGLRHVVLIGDECQLPAMVMSEVCQRAYFGRSLFERLVSLGHEKHLLNVQYRMHPNISIFPNVEFYDKLIMDGENVKSKSYERVYLPSRMC